MKFFLPLILSSLIISWNGEKIHRSDSEWKDRLGEERFQVMRQKKTERGFIGKYVYHEEKGTYSCAACELPLFNSTSKLQISCGWPSFKEPACSNHVYYLLDPLFPKKRYEVLCSRCDSHLGHIFKDGPPPKHYRYTINSISLIFSRYYD